MNGVRAVDRRNIYMHVYVVTYTITSFTTSMLIYHFVPQEVLILETGKMPASGWAGVKSPVCVSSVRLLITVSCPV